MTSITASDLLTIIFVLVDDWYQAHGIQYLFNSPLSEQQVAAQLLIVRTFNMNKSPLFENFMNRM